MMMCGQMFQSVRKQTRTQATRTQLVGGVVVGFRLEPTGIACFQQDRRQQHQQG